MSLLRAMLLIVGVILVIDQLYLFGIPIGPFLPNLGSLDPTQPYTDVFHHWMVGVVLIFVALFVIRDRRRK